MANQELDYDVPNRLLVWVWLALAVTATISGFWRYPVSSMAVLSVVTLVWVNLYSTILHYALDAEEFTKLPKVGGAFVRFQSHHFPKWINLIHRKPVLDLVGELNPVAVINLASALALLRLRYREAFVAWGVLMLAGGYAMLCHRWAHQPVRARPRIACALQRARLALNPEQHWAHHALAASPMGAFVPNFDLSFGWSNGLFNRVLKVLPSPRLWLGFIVAATLTQVAALTLLLHWLRR
jgi:Lipid desaturase domain